MREQSVESKIDLEAGSNIVILVKVLFFSAFVAWNKTNMLDRFVHLSYLKWEKLALKMRTLLTWVKKIIYLILQIYIIIAQNIVALDTSINKK